MRWLLFRWAALTALIMLPVLLLFFAQGAISLYSHGLFPASLAIGIGALFISLLVACWLYWKNRQKGELERESVDMVEANPAWGAQQSEAWALACHYIDERLAANDGIQDLPEHSLAVLREVASVWNDTEQNIEYAITLPEGLLAAETLAARYRRVLIENIPFSNAIKLSHVLSVWDMYQNNEKLFKYSHQAYRVYRLSSVGGLISELGSTVFSTLTQQAKENLIYNLKRAYLQEVANVSIDLYSGNFKNAIDELPVYQDTQRDLKNLAEVVGPIRIMIIGQTSSGKSSLTNAVLEEFRAEAGLVPTTTEERVYEFSVAEGFDTHIIDTPGIEAAPSELNNALDRLTKADLVIWVMRANQPARSIDQALFDRFESFFEENPQRQRPAVLVAATHIDRIASSADADEEKLAEVTAPLANACRKVVRYDGFCPLALSNPEQGLAGFRTALAEYYERAINTRLNRLRTNKSSLFESASEELSSLKAGTLAAVKLMVQNQKGS